MVGHRVFSFARARLAAGVREWLPDPHDARYPRPGWFSILREIISNCWVVLIGYLSYVLTSGVLQALHRGIASVWTGAAILHLLLLDRIIPMLESRQWFLGPLLGILGLCIILAWRWAAEDRARESKVLLARVVRGATGISRLRTVGVFGIRWLGHQARLTGFIVTSILAGVAFALLSTLSSGPTL
jgi:hypothetical protein